MSLHHPTMRVDAHHHFWRYTAEEFGWIDDGMAAIRRDFLPADLKPLLDEVGVYATVAVQARQSLEETEWLLSLAAEQAWIAGVVGWAPLASPIAEARIEALAVHSRLKGVRHVLQAEPDEYMLREDFNDGISLLKRYGLTYDLLVQERQLTTAIQFVDRHCEQPIVLDHVAKPRIAAGELEPWRTQIRELARRPHVCCKLSGMVTEADFCRWTEADMRPYVETVLDAFGPKRLMFGSDWPVCTVAASYSRWADVAGELLSELSVDERASIFGDNAVTFYQLARPEPSYEVQAT